MTEGLRELVERITNDIYKFRYHSYCPKLEYRYTGYDGESVWFLGECIWNDEDDMRDYLDILTDTDDGLTDRESHETYLNRQCIRLIEELTHLLPIFGKENTTTDTGSP